MRYRWLACLFGCLLLASCNEIQTRDATTQVTLRIQVADAALLGQLTDIRILLMREEDVWVRASEQSFPVQRFPIDVPVLPRSPKAATKRFEAIVDGLGPDGRITQSRVITSYAVGTVRVLDVWLHACAGGTCAADDCHGESCATCGSGGCEQVLVVNPSDLPRLSEGSPVVGGEAGMPHDAGMLAPPDEAGVLPPSDDAAALPPPDDAGQTVQDAAPGAPDGAVTGSCTGEGALRCKGQAGQQREQCELAPRPLRRQPTVGARTDVPDNGRSLQR